MPRKPLPIATLKLRGSKWAALREKAEGSPQTLPVCEPVASKPTHPEAAAHWTRLVPVLLESGVLTAADGDALARLCVIYAAFDKLQAIELGSPEWSKLFLKLNTAATALEACFGMHPANRVKLAKAKPESPRDALDEKKARFLK